MAEPNEKTSPPEPAGVFDSDKGIETTATEAQEPKEAAEGTPDPQDLVQQLRSELQRKDDALSRLSTRGASYEKRLQELEPYARAGLAIANDPDGAVILGKLERGERLSAGEEGAVAAVEKATATMPSIGPVEVRSIIREELGANKAAEKHTDKMLKGLREEYEDFDDVMNSARFWPIVDRTLGMIEDGSMPLDADGQEPYECAFRHAYHSTAAANPVIRKARKEATEVNAKKAAAAVVAAEAAGGSASSDTETPQQSSESNELVRMLKLYKGLETGGPTGSKFAR